MWACRGMNVLVAFLVGSNHAFRMIKSCLHRCGFDNFMWPWAFASGTSGKLSWLTESLDHNVSYRSTQMFPMFRTFWVTHSGKSLQDDPDRIWGSMYSISRPESHSLQVHLVTSTCIVALLGFSYRSGVFEIHFRWPFKTLRRASTDVPIVSKQLSDQTVLFSQEL